MADKRTTNHAHEASYTDNNGLSANVWCRNEYQKAQIQLLDRIAYNLEQLVRIIYTKENR